MTFNPTPRQRLFLLQLLFAGGSAGMKDLKPEFTRADRTPLKAAKWIDERKVNRSLEFSLTDAGWGWVEAHLADPMEVGRNTAAAAGALQQLLPRIASYLTATNVRLSDVILATQASTALDDMSDPKPSASTELAGLHKAIEAACLRLGGGVDRQRLRLTDVRNELGEWDHTTQNTAFLELATAGRLVLYGMSDPQEIQPEDRAAELKTPSGEARHLVYWTGHRGKTVG
jgi:hypothetical protein